MPSFKLDPFQNLRKNGHIWRGEKAILWYHERLDSSWGLLVLYDFGDRKRRLVLEVDDQNSRVEFKNDEISAEQYMRLAREVESMEKILNSN